MRYCVFMVSSRICMLTFLLPPVRVTFTNRRVYVMRFFARPLGVFFFSWGSTYNGKSISYHSIYTLFWHGVIALASCQGRGVHGVPLLNISLHMLIQGISYLWCLRLDFSGTSEGSVDFSHDCGLSGADVMAFRSGVAKDVSCCFLVFRGKQR
jgi:hypothetical protein